MVVSARAGQTWWAESVTAVPQVPSSSAPPAAGVSLYRRHTNQVIYNELLNFY